MLTGHSDLYETIVTVYVGPDSYAFHIYKELLCRDSPFFKAALDGNFKEGSEQTVSLPEDDVGTFRIYQTWLNTTQLRYNFDHVEWWLCFAKLWVLADKIRSTALRNRTVDAICATVRLSPDLHWASPQAVCYTFDNTSSDSPLRTLIVYHAYYNAKKSPSSSDLEVYPMAFLSRLTYHTLRNAQIYTGTLTDNIAKSFESPRYHLECSDKCCTVTSSKKTSGKPIVKRQHRV